MDGNVIGATGTSPSMPGCQAADAESTHVAVTGATGAGSSGRMFFHPGDVVVHPALQEFFGVGIADVTGIVE